MSDREQSLVAADYRWEERDVRICTSRGAASKPGRKNLTDHQLWWRPVTYTILQCYRIHTTKTL